MCFTHAMSGLHRINADTLLSVDHHAFIRESTSLCLIASLALSDTGRVMRHQPASCRCVCVELPRLMASSSDDRAIRGTERLKTKKMMNH